MLYRVGRGWAPLQPPAGTEQAAYISVLFSHLLSHMGETKNLEYQRCMSNLARCQQWPVACHAKLVVNFAFIWYQRKKGNEQVRQIEANNIFLMKNSTFFFEF